MKSFKFIPSPNVLRSNAHPTPMKKQVPDWYKNAEKTYTAADGQEAPGLKTCFPFLDGLTSGFALTVPVDVHVSKGANGQLKLEWDRTTVLADFISERTGAIGETMPRPAGHEHNHLVWSSQWGWQVPKGHSVLVTHPVNRFDLPFTTMSAIVDSDRMIAWGNIPFFIKTGFEGVIPAGTPFAQLIPFKRDNWVFVEDWLSTEKAVDQGYELRSGDAMYRKLFRKSGNLFK